MGTPIRRDSFLRPAFAMNGWIMMLFVLLLAVCVYCACMQWSRLPPAGGAYAAGVRLGIWGVPVVVPLLFLGISWGVGKLVSLMFGKSDDAGNAGAAVVMLGVLSLFCYNAYSLATAAPTPAPALASKSGARSSTPLSPDQSTSLPQDAVEQARKQADAASRTPQIALPPSQQIATQTPDQSAPASAGSPTKRPPAAPRSTDANPTAKPVISAFAKEINEQIDTLVTSARQTLPKLSKAPAHSVTELQSRTKETEALAQSARAIADKLKSAEGDLRDKLSVAGLSSSDAQFAAFNWANMEFKAHMRALAADSIVDLCEKSKDECEFLKDNIGKWTLDSKGEFKSKDVPFEQKIGSNRFFVRAEADRRTQTIDQLLGR